jgi:hypothetical protein
VQDVGTRGGAALGGGAVPRTVEEQLVLEALAAAAAVDSAKRDER